MKNFLQYVDDKGYNGTIFHRVIDGFMIQGGGFTKDLSQKPTRAPVKNEAANGLKNQRGTLAMARTSDVDSATCQFFINVADNGFLDHSPPHPQGFGYCVFGKVVEGMDVVDKIKGVATTTRGPYQNVPAGADRDHRDPAEYRNHGLTATDIEEATATCAFQPRKTGSDMSLKGSR